MKRITPATLVDAVKKSTLKQRLVTGVSAAALIGAAVVGGRMLFSGDEQEQQPQQQSQTAAQAPKQPPPEPKPPATEQQVHDAKQAVIAANNVLAPLQKAYHEQDKVLSRLIRHQWKGGSLEARDRAINAFNKIGEKYSHLDVLPAVYSQIKPELNGVMAFRRHEPSNSPSHIRDSNAKIRELLVNTQLGVDALSTSQADQQRLTQEKERERIDKAYAPLHTIKGAMIQYADSDIRAVKRVTSDIERGTEAALTALDENNTNNAATAFGRLSAAMTRHSQQLQRQADRINNEYSAEKATLSEISTKLDELAKTATKTRDALKNISPQEKLLNQATQLKRLVDGDLEYHDIREKLGEDLQTFLSQALEQNIVPIFNTSDINTMVNPLIEEGGSIKDSQDFNSARSNVLNGLDDVTKRISAELREQQRAQQKISADVTPENIKRLAETAIRAIKRDLEVSEIVATNMDTLDIKRQDIRDATTTLANALSTYAEHQESRGLHVTISPGADGIPTMKIDEGIPADGKDLASYMAERQAQIKANLNELFEDGQGLVVKSADKRHQLVPWAMANGNDYDLVPPIDDAYALHGHYKSREAFLGKSELRGISPEIGDVLFFEKSTSTPDNPQYNTAIIGQLIDKGVRAAQLNETTHQFEAHDYTFKALGRSQNQAFEQGDDHFIGVGQIKTLIQKRYPIRETSITATNAPSQEPASDSRFIFSKQRGGASEGQDTGGFLAPSYNEGAPCLLFVGNSLTQRNRMAGMVAAMARLDNDSSSTLCTEEVTQDNASLAIQRYTKARGALPVMYNNNTMRNLVTNQNWDAVILQDFSHTFTKDPDNEEAINGIKKFARSLKRTEEKPVLFETWASRENFEAEQNNIREGYQQAARESGAYVVPVGEIWREAVHKGLSVHDADGGHPNMLGSYLTALVFYSTFTGKPAQSTHYKPARISEDQAQQAKQIVDEHLREILHEMNPRSARDAFPLMASAEQLQGQAEQKYAHAQLDATNSEVQGRPIGRTLNRLHTATAESYTRQVTKQRDAEGQGPMPG